MSIPLLVWTIVLFQFYGDVVTEDSEISLSYLNDKMLQFEKLVIKQNDRISYLEENLRHQKDEIQALKQLINKHEPEIRFIKHGLNILRKIIMKKQFGKSRSNENYPTNPEKVHGTDNGIVRRKVIAEESISLFRKQDTQNLSVAFYAYLSYDVSDPGKKYTLIFNVIKTNTRAAYNNNTGVFTVPISGLYVFTCSIAMDGENAFASYEIMKNSEIAGTFFVDAEFEDSYKYSSLTIVIQVQQADTVLVRIGNSYSQKGNVFSRSYARSSFAGWKIN